MRLNSAILAERTFLRNVFPYKRVRSFEVKKMLRQVLFASILLLLYAAQFPHTALSRTLAAPATEAQGEEIPFAFVNGHLISVRGSIGSRANLQFLLDFGTTYTLLDRTLAKELEQGASLDVAHFSNSIRTSEAVLPELMVGNVVARDFHVYMMDISEMPGVPTGVVGVIGMDFLERQNVTIDFGEMKIKFLPPMEKNVAGEHSAPLAKRGVGYAVDAEWRGQPVKLILSTGVEAVTLDQDRLREKPVTLRGIKAGIIGSNFTATPVSVFQTKEMTLNNVKLQGAGVLRKIDWPVSGGDLDGFLPLTALRARRVTLDFSRHLLLWSVSWKLPEPPDGAEQHVEPASPQRKR